MALIRQRLGSVRPQCVDAELAAGRSEILQPVAPANYRVLTALATNPDNYFVLSCGGGSAPALAGNAALTAILEELDLRRHVREIWGTSAGAIVGGGWATGTPAPRMLELLIDMHRSGIVDCSRWDLFGWPMLQTLLRRRLPEGFIPGRHFRDYTQRGLRVATFADCEIPFRAIACRDDGSARKVVFRDGPLINAIMASICLPGIMRPVPDWSGGEFGYFDGGVLEKTPLASIIEDHARQLRRQRLVVLCSHFNYRDKTSPPRGFMQRFLASNNLMEGLVWDAQLERARQGAGKFLVVSPEIRHGAYFDFSRIEEYYLAARRDFTHQLSNAGMAARFDAR
ncbi:MAG: Patatin-like phospholipase [candidate division BRC1 bacterium ADurb.BinA292]|nr:MAG: Patatin-like phospholipase [candidate division BRC1 bacterium ADurb.BinA292]